MVGKRPGRRRLRRLSPANVTECSSTRSSTKDESQELADWLATTGKNLTEVYITHAHGDHFFGLNTVLDRVPKARRRRAAGARAVACRAGDARVDADLEQLLSLTSCSRSRVVPVALDKPELEVEGHTLHVLKLGQSDVADSTAVHVPDLDTFFPATSSTTASTSGCTSPITRTGWTGSRRERGREARREDDHRRAHRPRGPGQRRRTPDRGHRQYIYDFDEAVRVE
jgi:hypothetical protein